MYLTQENWTEVGKISNKDFAEVGSIFSPASLAEERGKKPSASRPYPGGHRRGHVGSHAETHSETGSTSTLPAKLDRADEQRSCAAC